MLKSAQWTVEVFLDTDDWGNTHAEAFLLTSGDAPVFARGSWSSALTGRDTDDDPDADARMVAARALAELARRLLDADPEALANPEGARTTAQRDGQPAGRAGPGGRTRASSQETLVSVPRVS